MGKAWGKAVTAALMGWALALFLAGWAGRDTGGTENVQRLWDAAASAGVAPREVTLHAYRQVDAGTRADRPEALLARFQQRVIPTARMTVTPLVRHEWAGLRATAEPEKGVTVHVVALEGPGGARVVTVNWTRQALRAADVRRDAQRLSAWLAAEGLPAHLDIALRGEWTGKGQGDLREAATAAVLRALRATVVEAAVDDAMYSVSGTSPLLFGGVRTGGGEMNVQVAASRPQGDGGVGVTVGTPLIFVEY
ncbi:YwmB family TATA-box binding protein [Calditerricola satsumensis]|uniref:TATA-box binding n=2 Tax=Calditerricola satsumensis TaxID=373054 RepID=A0A8J3BBQ1_9BACI|nr:YwmB family TATA-box binding protein [Calditerricola satsumensis]GGJ96004.1 hypothetical protein GCM10007043_07290 [Calditerricola satsumensis]